MLIPSIDLMQGQAVQLISGKTPALEAGDPFLIAEKWSKVGPLAVIDLDAALGQGTHKDTIKALCKHYRCRVGGGIRDLDTAYEYLNAGAEHIIIGTAATPEFLQHLPKDRVIVALDAWEGEVVVEGWTSKTGQQLTEQLPKLAPYADGFLITFVEKEGRMEGTNLSQVARLVELAGDAWVTIAGGVTTVEDIRILDQLGADAQVGMALYTKTLSLAEAFCAPLNSDRDDGLWPTVVVDELDRALGLCYSNLSSIEHALEQGKGVYWSRKRGLWVKGESSGHTQELIQIDIDCDRDCLRFKVRQKDPGFCHLDTRSCWGALGGLPSLVSTVQQRAHESVEGSYTQRLWQEKGLLEAKLLEEAQELLDAPVNQVHEVVHEFADVLYFATVALVRAGASLEQVYHILDQRHKKVTRRTGDAKTTLSKDQECDTLTVYSFSNRPNIKAESLDPKVMKKAKKIVDQVQSQGIPAVLNAIEMYEHRTITAKQLVVTPQQLKAAYLRLSSETQNLLQRVAQRIETFAQAQKDSLSSLEMKVLGGEAGHRIQAIEKVACYAPGGRFPLPSSVLMTAITAKVAGSTDIWVVSPSQNDVLWGAAWVAGVKGLINAGGAHAVSAVTYGCDDLIPRCDLIVGPGNQWVTAAKFWVSKDIGIDMLAGPSELLVVADESAQASVVAADLLAQAEHDIDALPILVSASSQLITEVNQALTVQLKTLKTASIARQALANGYAILCESDEQLITCANEIAPEHLEVIHTQAEQITAQLKHYGGLFIGEQAAEVFGDYGVGPNHVLPTGRTARWSGGLSIFNFVRVCTWLKGEGNRSEYQTLVNDTVALASLEGLHAHAEAALMRG